MTRRRGSRCDGLFEDSQRSVTAPVVDHQKFVRTARCLIEHREHAPQQLGKHLLLVVDGDGDGHAPAVHLGTPTKYTICQSGRRGSPNA